MIRVAFTVLIQPSPGGSKRTNAAGAVFDANPRAKAAKHEIAAAAFKAAPAELLDGPLGMALTFYRARPKGHYGSGRNANRIKPSAPNYPTTAPDIDKTARLVVDALTTVVYRDDSQIVMQQLEKLFGAPERIDVVVWTVDPMTYTLTEAWAEFQLAGRTPTNPAGDGSFQALCPVCGGQLFAMPDDHGRVRLDCWTSGCDQARIGSELAFRTGVAMADSQEPATEKPAPTRARETEERRRLTLTVANTVQPAPVRWLLRGLVPLRGAVVIAGDPGLGKSIFTDAWLVAQVTHGQLDGDFHNKPADVLVATAEDDWATVVVPRLMAAGADLSRVHLVAVDGTDGDRLLTVPDDLERVDHALAGLDHLGTPAALFVIDPISAFLSDAIDTHRDAQVRRALAPLADIAVRRDLVAAVVAHLTKDASQRLLQRVSGATAFGAAPRSVLAFARHPEDPDGDRGSLRAIVHAKSNWGRYAPTLAARVEGREIDLPSGKRMETGYLVMMGETDVTAEDLQRGRDDDTGGNDVQDAIGAALASGPQHSRDVKGAVAAEIGCSRRTVERHAQQMVQRGDLEITEGGFPRTTTWVLCSRDTASGATEPVATDATRIPEPNPGVENGSGASAPGVSRLADFRGRDLNRMLEESDD